MEWIGVNWSEGGGIRVEGVCYILTSDPAGLSK